MSIQIGRPLFRSASSSDGDHTTKPIALKFHEVSFSYGDTLVLDHVDVHFHEGDFTALVGPNGAGKSTVLKLALGLERPDSGTVTVFGSDPRSVLDSIGYVPQNIQYDRSFPISVKEVVAMGLLHPKTKLKTQMVNTAVAEALEQVAISDLARRPYSALSGGQRRRVLVARALVAKPRFLILDEPTANMDAESENLLFQTLGKIKGSTTILIVTHDSGFVSALTDIVLCLGDRSECGHAATIVRHRAAFDAHAPATLFGGEALRVLHDVSIPGDNCHPEGGPHA